MLSLRSYIDLKSCLYFKNLDFDIKILIYFNQPVLNKTLFFFYIFHPKRELSKSESFLSMDFFLLSFKFIT